MTSAAGDEPDRVAIRRLERQVRLLQIAMFGLGSVAVLAAAARGNGEVQAQRLALVDAAGRERIVLSAVGNQGRPSLEFRTTAGTRRLTLGEEPDPVMNGRAYPRVSPAWGLLIYDSRGDERGGFANLDMGRSIVSLDRANGEGVYMTVNERSGFAGMVANYAASKPGEYAEAIRLGTLGRQAFAQVANRDGTPAGAVAAGQDGRARLTDVVQR